MERVSIVCFLASYATALGLEAWHQWRPRPVWRVLALGFGAAGLVAHTIYLYSEQPPLIWQFGWLMFAAWILAIFYLSGSLHYRRIAWGVFVLPLIVGLLTLGLLFGRPPAGEHGLVREQVLTPDRLWGPLHAGLLLLAFVGMCVAFLASTMYLFQAGRLRSKTPPGRGLRMLSLEKLESMNRRAIALAFPLLTGGVLAGGVQLLRGSDLVRWTDPRVLATGLLWLVFVVLFYLRYAHHLRGRPVALATIAAFVLLLGCLALSHPLGPQPLPPGGDLP